MSTNIEFVPDFSLDPVYFADWLLRHDENNLYHQYESVKTNMHGTDVVGMANVRIDVRKDENGSLIYFPRGSQQQIPKHAMLSFHSNSYALDLTFEQPRIETTCTEKRPVFWFYGIWATCNFQHFCVELLSKLQLYIELRRMVPRLALLVGVLPSYAMELLKLHPDININRDLVWIQPTTLYETVVFPTNYIYNFEMGSPRMPMLRNVAHAIVNNVLSRGPLSVEPTTPERIYISRRKDANSGKSRVMINEDEVVNAAQKSGFTEVHLGELNTEQKIRLMQNVTDIVAPFGAGLTNLLFCSEKLKSVRIILSPIDWAGEAFFKELLPLHLQQQVKITTYRCVAIDPNNKDINQSYFVPKEVLSNLV